MPKSLTPERQAELDALYKLTCAIVEFQRAELSADMATMLQEVVERTYRDRSLPGMRQIRDDLLAATQGTIDKPNERQRLDALLRSRTGQGLTHHLAAHNAQISKIRDRGFIAGDRQYYLVKEYLELVTTDPQRQTEVAEVQALLSAYEQNATRRDGRRDRDPAA